MDLIQGYSNDSSEDESPTAPKMQLKQAAVPVRVINSAPHVDTYAANFNLDQHSIPLDATTQIVQHNPKVNAMFGYVEGPENPYVRQKDDVKQAHIEDFSFQEQYNTFESNAYAVDPTTGTGLIGNQENMIKHQGATVYSSRVGNSSNMPSKKRRKRGKNKPIDNTADIDLGDGSAGPWAPIHQTEEELEISAEQEKYRAELQKRREAVKADQAVEAADLPEYRKEDELAETTSSEFHGGEKVDYQGRSWVEAPSYLKPTEHDCFVPKRCTHTWAGHQKGVQAIRFFPLTGHLILSASMDTTVKIWDVYNNRKVRRTYKGHNAPVRDVQFNTDGHRFLSASYDKTVKYWDTETGKCIGSFSNKKVPYCVKFYPLDDNIFLAGCGDKKVIQWDVRSGEIVQTYDHHLGAVNALEFVDEGRRFMSTSDDKKVLVWEYNLPVPIVYISEEGMYSIPSVTLSPAGNVVAGQSMDNTIVTFQTGEKTRLNRKKTFKGHINAGFACEIAFSPDGRFISSGDSTGNLWIWNYRNSKVYKKLMKCHNNGPCISTQWHPIEPSLVATCGWDGLIKCWE